MWQHKSVRQRTLLCDGEQPIRTVAFPTCQNQGIPVFFRNGTFVEND